MSDFTIIKSTTESFEINIPLDLTGTRVVFVAKKQKADEGFAITKDAQITDDANGKAVVILSRDDTNIAPGEYYYAVVMKDAAESVFPVADGMFVVETNIAEGVFL